MENLKNSKFNKIEAKARKGDIDAAFQLYNFYLNGKYLEKDSEKAQEYLDLVLSQFRDQKIRIASLSLLNFRIAERLSIRFNNEHTQVLIGNNGAGKTTVLDAISHSLSWLIRRIVNSGGKGRDIDKSDITMGNNDGYSSIITKLTLYKDYSPTLELCEVEEGSIVKKKSYYSDFTQLGNLYKLSCDSDDKFELPLFAYYGVMRSMDINSKDMVEFDETTANEIQNRFDGYSGSIAGKADFKAFFRWYKRLDDLVKHENQNVPQTDLKFISMLEELADSDPQAKKVLNKLLSKMKPQSEPEEISYAAKTQRIINKTIPFFMDGFSNLKVELKPTLHLSIEKEGIKTNVLQLSQGEKSLLALILDITRRLAALNPDSENPLLCSGIVLIDEIDLHLHPEWQRNIIKKLETAFPNCQFIVTTHSPQIISEIKHDQIFILGKDESGNFNCFSPDQSYGLTSNDVLNEIMKTGDKTLVRSPEVQNGIDEIFSLISKGDLESASRKIAEMEKELHGEIPELANAKFDIELHGWDKE
ncbi:AAA family ATPase [Lonsdalea quercina]|uniref:Endonuclease GajA/Old nuclease/RecF-like AAA domain-containing protein n=1 Tax=Lonsdalea britannica TaxID=1082704 RepID=A0AAD0WKQ0_9GAMM|nr:AAA family ATPase [Lonsdalea britannica]AXW87007.1 hypothetical protein CKQ53_08440 [Lonsdalea britannica]OSM99305.1 hypothetical protein AU509_05200 [Lonsdalea britannica]